MSVSSSIYSPLPPKSYTRMIRLLPDEDKDAPIRCELFSYNLSRSSNGGHLYEVFSYVWGSPARSRSIILNGCSFLIMESLHTALLHLRDTQLDRVLWVDAISINQDDDSEKSKQIPLMRMIYAQARRVVVWLGMGWGYGDKALELLGSLGRKQNPESINEKDRERCEALLQRDWFRCIWVLQEVGVAQSIIIMCGTVQINGHIFCEGLDNLEPSPRLMARVSPVSYLIKGALFRSHDRDLSVPTLSIGELVSMYRNHNVIKQHDKVYALLGLSSDSNSAVLAPDYERPWHEVFRQAAQHVFAKCSVEICYEPETAIIRVAFNQICQKLGYCDKWMAEWSLQASGDLLQDGDIICLLEGLSQPSVLRLCADYYTVVIPVVKPKEWVQNTEDNVRGGGNYSAHGLYDILLGWKASEPEDKADSKSLSRLVGNGPNNHKHCEAERSLNHTISVMVDAAIQLFKLGVPERKGLDNVLSKGRVKGVDINFLLSQSNGTVSNNLITAVEAVLWQKHESPHFWEKMLVVAVRDPLPCGFIITSILLQRLQGRLPVPEEVVKAAAANEEHGHQIIPLFLEHRGDKLPIMQLLLEYHGDKLPISKEVVKAAAANEEHGYQIMQLLLVHRGDKLPVFEEVVKAAAVNKNHRYEIMHLLLEYHGDKLPISEEMVKAAAANEEDGYQIMQLLLEHHGDKLPISEEVVKAAAVNEEHGHQIMQLLLEYHGDKLPVSEEVVKAAAVNEITGHQIMQLLLEYHRDKLPISEEVVKAAAANEEHGHQIMQLLLEHRGDKLPVFEEMVKVAAMNKNHRYEIMHLLLEYRGNKLPVSEEVVKAVAANDLIYGPAIMQLLLRHRGDKLPISEEVVKAAAANEKYGHQIMQLLLRHRGDKLPVSEEVVKAAAANEITGHQIMQLLLEHRGDKLPISEEVVKAAAANANSGPAIMQLFLEHRGDKPPVLKKWSRQ
ncbi:HET domain-containing protein [Aspergillus ibericus CBS 121593]|uniref:Heterokaryon incompatibility domain-containing protein n=1 Tax=Aspergillus ibericus CBS 121593 TaxID=1448316 RepID=A0A395H4X3_9EURO|nr:hypothetical protein BO80DRAFT_352706 [Aspergillus ibericus CBS 121593]RAL02265.1 hypothetical protein BO80DRAFT_352706 [Aspergillus ibericus CBS 121593]